MGLIDILIGLGLVVIIGQFWKIRAISESARAYLRHYCDKQGLQLIAMARHNTTWVVERGVPCWQCEYRFEFSGNGSDTYVGSILMRGEKVVQTDLPPYRVGE